MQARAIGMITALIWPRGTIQSLSHVHSAERAHYEPKWEEQEIMHPQMDSWPVNQEAMDHKMTSQLTCVIRLYFTVKVWEYILPPYSTAVKLIPRRAECLQVFTPHLYSIDELRSWISEGLLSTGYLGLNWMNKTKTYRHTALRGMSLILPVQCDLVWCSMTADFKQSRYRTGINL